MDEKKEPILVHLAALRVCIIKSLLGVLTCMIISYIFVDYIMLILKTPMITIMPDSSSFVVLAPQEYFFTELKAALFFGVVISCPWIFVQIWHFVAPGLHQHEKHMLVLFTCSASFCFILGILFAYFLVFPPTFKFFLETLPAGITGSYSIGMLYGFAITILISFGVVFQTPIAVLLLILFDLVSLDTLKSYRRIIFVMSFVIGAILTPPDPITQVMLAIPMYLLFELGLLIAGIARRRVTARGHE